ncbi:hypothetical protein L0F63_005815, partial [Massospora cicadina]
LASYCLAYPRATSSSSPIYPTSNPNSNFDSLQRSVDFNDEVDSEVRMKELLCKVHSAMAEALFLYNSNAPLHVIKKKVNLATRILFHDDDETIQNMYDDQHEHSICGKVESREPTQRIEVKDSQIIINYWITQGVHNMSEYQGNGFKAFGGFNNSLFIQHNATQLNPNQNKFTTYDHNPGDAKLYNTGIYATSSSQPSSYEGYNPDRSDANPHKYDEEPAKDTILNQDTADDQKVDEGPSEVISNSDDEYLNYAYYGQEGPGAHPYEFELLGQ